MVVSCQKHVVCLCSFLFLLLIPSVSFAGGRALTDAELDAVVAGNLPENITHPDLTPLIKENVLPKSLALVGALLNPELLTSSGLVRVNAIDSDVSVQTNILVVSGVQGANINLSNVYASK